MNKVFVSGIVASIPILKKEDGNLPHLLFSLGTRHKTRSGKIKYEKYTVNAWNHVALWGNTNLHQGQPLTIQGYLTQRVVKTDDLSLIMTEITAEEFTPNILITKPSTIPITPPIPAVTTVEMPSEEPNKAIIEEIIGIDNSSQ